MTKTIFFGKLLLVWLCASGLGASAQTGPDAPARLQNGPNEKAIMAYYTAFEKNDWDLIQPVLADGFTFSSPLDDHINIEAFKQRCWPNASNIKKFEVVKMLVEGDNAFVIYNGWTKEGKLFRNSDYFVFENGKIKSYECFFGPGVNYPNSGK